MNSKPGQVVSRAFEWKTPVMRARLDKSVEEMSAEERAMKERLEKELQEGLPSHRLTFKNGRVMEGTIVEEHKRYILFQETYGDNGNLSVKVRRRRMKHIEELERPLPEASYRDVAFQMEFPNMQLYKRAPYTILTDESFFKVEGAVRTLSKLHDALLQRFASLIREQANSRDIQVVIFFDEASFRACQETYAPHMENTAGFYSPWADRLVLFNQATSKQMRELYDRIEEDERNYHATAEHDYQHKSIDSWRRGVDRSMEKLAEEYTRSTIRHEGAHQLLFKYGVHSSHHIENEWLVEGLATYCEFPYIGFIDRVRLERIRKKQHTSQFFMLFDLVNATQASGFVKGGSVEIVDLAYSQSWLLVHLLMRPEFQSKFYAYIRYVRDPDHFKEIKKQDRYELLCKYMDLTPASLEEKWTAYLEEL